VYILRIKENEETLVVACKETGIEGNADKTKYIIFLEISI
jgi:hypothetical protein